VRALASILAVGLFVGCLPNPQSVKERREEFDRDDLQGDLLLNQPPNGMIDVGAVFGDRIKLLGYTLDPVQPKRGDNVEVRLYWTALTPISEDYQVFVHGDSIGGYARRLHGDHFPAKGKYPTDVWRENDVVVDPFDVNVPGDYGPKQLGINLGLYKGNYRVPLTSPGKGGSDNENRSRPITLTFE